MNRRHTVFQLVAPYMRPGDLYSLATNRRVSKGARANANHGLRTWKGADALAAKATADFCNVNNLSNTKRSREFRVGRWRIAYTNGTWQARWSDHREFPSYRLIARLIGHRVRLETVPSGSPPFEAFRNAVAARIRRRCGVDLW